MHNNVPYISATTKNNGKDWRKFIQLVVLEYYGFSTGNIDSLKSIVVGLSESLRLHEVASQSNGIIVQQHLSMISQCRNAQRGVAKRPFSTKY